eukprot:jgi/Tetstr1/464828/TSEL_009567.t1
MGATGAQSVRTFFAQNQFIDLDHARRFGVGAAEQLKAILPEGLLLDTTVVHPTLVEQLDEMVADVLEKGQWLDVSDVVPVLLPLEEVAMLMSRCSAIATMHKAKRGAILADVCVDVLKRAEFEGKAAARGALLGEEAPMGTAGCSQQLQPEMGSEAVAAMVSELRLGGDGAEGACSGEGHLDEEHQQHMAPTKGAKRGKDGKRVQKAFKGKEGRCGVARGASGARHPGKAGAAQATLKRWKPTARALTQRVVDWYPETDTPVGDHDSMAEVLAAEALPVAAAEFSRLVDAAGDGIGGMEEGDLMRELNARLVEMVMPNGTVDLVEMSS